MKDNEKIRGEERRELIVKTLQAAKKPISGRELGEMTNVSRQVIVGDINLLKAKDEPIIATSQGYVYMQTQDAHDKIEKTFVCRHRPEQTEEELHIFVDHGITVKDVKIEHPVYGDLSASIMVSNRDEVNEFIKKVREENASFLLNLSEGGTHLHTVLADTDAQLSKAEDALRKADILVE